jgi:peptidoglycan/xylan/chitin deacetylase (PgdA/CDA1 family)
MKLSAAAAFVLSCGLTLAAAGCGKSGAAASCRPASPRIPTPAPKVVLTPDELAVWTPLPPDRSAVPVLLYHGIGPPSDFANAADAGYGVDAYDFAKQMTMIKHAGYQTIGLQTFVDFVRGKRVTLPPRPLLLTFDDARGDSWTGSESILKKLHFTAVMFVDVGRVSACDPEYLTWDELRAMQHTGRWNNQLHAGPNGHTYIQYGSSTSQTGPYYAYKKPGEDFSQWQDRVRSDIEAGQKELAEQIPGYEPLAFSPPFGAYGQEGTNDERIPPDLLAWLTGRYEAVFTQDVNALAKPGSSQPLGRIQVTRATSGGQLHSELQTGK